MNLERATEVFVTAFSRIKSQTHPYPARRLGRLWVMSDSPRPKPRKTEVVAVDLAPVDVVSQIKEDGLGWHFLCHLAAAESPDVKAAYKRLGYRAMSTEWMFVHDLQDIPEFVSDPPVRLIGSQGELDATTQLAQHKMRLMPGSRLFGVSDQDRDYGWVRSLLQERDAWVSGLFVRSDSRRRGYGRALMSALLQADKAHGVENSVLLASSSGAKLYPLLGYGQIGVLQMFCPADRSRFAAK